MLLTTLNRKEKTTIHHIFRALQVQGQILQARERVWDPWSQICHGSARYIGLVYGKSPFSLGKPR